MHFLVNDNNKNYFFKTFEKFRGKQCFVCTFCCFLKDHLVVVLRLRIS